jgi:hypothetical protein
VTTTISAGPLVPLETPTPERRRFDLLSTVPITEPKNDRWLGGAWTGGEVPGPAFTHDPCSDGTDRIKMAPGVVETQKSKRFTVYLPGFCQAKAIGPDPGFWTDKLARVFEVYESAAVERALATGDGHLDIGPFICDQNLELLNAGQPTSAAVGYALLEQAIARHGTGILHIGLRTFAAWHSFLVPGSDPMRTKLGTPVVIGYGYVNARPENADPFGEGQEWAFATGPIQVIRDREIDIVPGPSYTEALDRETNDALFIAERPYLLNWMARQSPTDDDHIQAGVLIEQGGFEDVIVIDTEGNIHIRVGASVIADLS